MQLGQADRHGPHHAQWCRPADKRHYSFCGHTTSTYRLDDAHSSFSLGAGGIRLQAPRCCMLLLASYRLSQQRGRADPYGSLTHSIDVRIPPSSMCHHAHAGRSNHSSLLKRMVHNSSPTAGLHSMQYIFVCSRSFSTRL
eukprot:5754170-Pleurochrysis_carterae.AAC.2